MNRKVIAWLILGLFLSSVANAGVKIGYVQRGKLLTEAPQIKAAEKKLESEFSARKDNILALSKDLRDLEEKLNRDARIMKDEERSSMERDILSRRRELKRLEREFKDDVSFRRNEILAKLQGDMSQVINKFAKDNGYGLVLADGAVFVDGKVDITDLILEKMRALYKKKK